MKFQINLPDSWLCPLAAAATATYICTLINPECRVYNLSVFRLKIGWCNLIGCKSNRVRSTVHKFFKNQRSKLII